jgi:hypothetical protein
MFMDADGEEIGLGDNQAIGPLDDESDHCFARVAVEAPENEDDDWQALAPPKEKLPSHVRLQAKNGLAFLWENPIAWGLSAFLAGIIA